MNKVAVDDDRRGSVLCEVAADRPPDARAPACDDGDGVRERIMSLPARLADPQLRGDLRGPGVDGRPVGEVPAGRAARAAGMCCTNRSPRPTGGASGS